MPAKKKAAVAKKSKAAATAKRAPKKPVAKAAAAKPAPKAKKRATKAPAKKPNAIARLTSGVGKWFARVTGRTKKKAKPKPAATQAIKTEQIILARPVGEPPPPPGAAK